MVKFIFFWFVLPGVCLAQSDRKLFDLDRDFSKIIMKPFYKGLYGKVGTATYFISNRSLIPDNDRLYWAIVHVLSKKYGCFLKKKLRKGAYTSFLCRDDRIIVFKHLWKGRYVIFSGRQFDRKGRELALSDRRIIGRYPLHQGVRLSR